MNLGKNIWLNEFVVYHMSSSIHDLLGGEGDYCGCTYDKYLNDISTSGHEIFNRTMIAIKENCYGYKTL